MQVRTAMLVNIIAKAIPHIRLLGGIYQESNGFDREILFLMMFSLIYIFSKSNSANLPQLFHTIRSYLILK